MIGTYRPPPTRENDASSYDELPDGVLVTGPAGEVIDINQAAAALLRTRRADVLGRSLDEVLPLADSSGRDWWHCTDPFGGLAIRTRQPEYLLTVTAGPAEGTRLLVTARFVREDGKLVRFVVSLRSSQARDRIDRARAEMVSAAAHELRSPLAGVRGFSRTLVTKWDRFEEADRIRMIMIVDSAMDRVTRLVDEMLDVSRLDLGTLSVQREVVDIGDLARRVVENRVAAGEPQSRFEVAVEEDLPLQWLDRTRMAQVLENLIDNAIRHGTGLISLAAEEASAPPEGLLPAGTAERYLLLSVSDEGPGVSPEVAHRIFRKFWRRERGGGTGLGLYLVKGIVEAHGGVVGVFDAPGGGARFVVCVPSEGPPVPPTAE